jgi:threonine dehydrogenase-like Zn-dependent dehydrogenase
VTLALRVLNMLEPNFGDWVTIIGQGAIGLLMTQLAQLKGCRVIAVDLDDYRLRLAEKYGAEFCINADREEVIQHVKKITKRG